MSEEQLKSVADGADMIVNGYAFTRSDGGVRVLNLNAPSRAALFDATDTMVETSMDDIEVGIVQDYLTRNREFLVTDHAEVF